MIGQIHADKLGLTSLDIHRIEKYVLETYKVNSFGISNLEVWHSVLRVKIRNIGYRFISKNVIYCLSNKNSLKATQTRLFKRFIYSHVRDWNVYDLKYLSLKQIKSLIAILGTTASGNKSKIITKIKLVVRMRLLVTSYAKLVNRDQSDVYEQIEQASVIMADDFKHKELLAFIRELKIFAHRNKRGMSKALIMWLLNCIARGTQEVKKAIAHIKHRRLQQAA